MTEPSNPLLFPALQVSRFHDEERGEISRMPPPGGDFGGGGGKGGGKPGDWVCPKGCGMVFASKSSCFKCGTPKPGGFGGGPAPVTAKRRLPGSGVLLGH